MWAHVFRLAALCVVAISWISPLELRADERRDPIRPLVGTWDIPGSLISITIHRDHTLDHSKLGSGTIQNDMVDYFTIIYRVEQNLTCRYKITKYSANEVSFVDAAQGSNTDCELGLLRRSPKSERDIDPQDSDTASEAPKVLSAEAERALRTTEVFKDCPTCPDMVVVPAGAFNMGQQSDPSGVRAPVHNVSFKSRFAVGRYAITRDQFEEFLKATGYIYSDGCFLPFTSPEKDEFKYDPHTSYRQLPFAQDGRHPAVCVSFEDAKAYADWISQKTHKKYRLLTEAEREYATRAGTLTSYWWGDDVDPQRANYDRRDRVAQPAPPAKPRKASSKSSDHVLQKSIVVPGGTVPVNAFSPNPWGLFQVHGNVAEWTLDCWNRTYIGAPNDGSPSLVGDCEQHVVRGGGWAAWPEYISSPSREKAAAGRRYSNIGFRLAREFDASEQ